MKDEKNTTHHEPPKDPCIWKEVYNHNINGVGTSFQDNPEIQCSACDGKVQSCLSYQVPKKRR
ncbi:hypothetical protein ACFL96_12865 [Thermoproteota archaeon]